jgi:hypothetical protein
LGSADAHNWRMCDGVQPDTDAHWLTAPLWLMDEKAKQQLRCPVVACGCRIYLMAFAAWNRCRSINLTQSLIVCCSCMLC